MDSVTPKTYDLIYICQYIKYGVIQVMEVMEVMEARGFQSFKPCKISKNIIICFPVTINIHFYMHI